MRDWYEYRDEPDEMEWKEIIRQAEQQASVQDDMLNDARAEKVYVRLWED